MYTVPKGTAKVVAPKGKRQVGGLVSTERGERITATICFSATGVYMPPLLIYPRKNNNPIYFVDLPEGASAAFDPSGYMTKDIFLVWMQQFIDFAKPSAEKKVLLILDGHSSHTRNAPALKLAKENHVIVLVLPPHCTHKSLISHLAHV